MPGRLYHIYCDESCTGKDHTHMVFGGIMLPADRVAAFEDSVPQWRERVNMRSELKWNKVTDNKLAEYKEFVHGIFRYIDKKELAFRSIVFKRCDLDHSTLRAKNNELGFNKLMFTFLFHCFLSRLFHGDRVLIFPDERHSYRPSELKRILNRKALAEWGWEEPVRSIEPVASHDKIVMQMNDVLMGAVGHQNNGRERVADCRPAKIELARFIAERARLTSLCVHTRQSAHFGIWQFQPRTKKAP